MAVPGMVGETVGERAHVVEALPGIAELAPEEGIGPVGLRPGPVEERVRGRRVPALRRGVGSPPEAPRRRQGAVVDQVAEHVGAGRRAAVPSTSVR